MKTVFRHDLGFDTTITRVARMGDDSGPLCALICNNDEQEVRIGIRVRTLEQADEMLVAITELRASLLEMLGEHHAAPPPKELIPEYSREAYQLQRREW